MKNILIAVIALLLLLGGGYAFYALREQPMTETAVQPLTTPSAMPDSIPLPQDTTDTQTAPPSVTPTEEPPPVVQDEGPEVVVVTYTDAGYTPSSVRIRSGDTVSFKNNSSRAMWTASAFHPTHRAYPTTGGCLGSTFDACSGIQPGSSWSFTFDADGTWQYHDHLQPAHTGTIIVE